MSSRPRNILNVTTPYLRTFREIGLDAEGVFSHPDIKPWRRLPDRENCVLDIKHHDGTAGRLHVKRYFSTRHAVLPADVEEGGYGLLLQNQIPTADLIAWGRVIDGRSFTFFADLAGYQPGDKLVASGFPFSRLLEPTADLAAALHGRGLHHRDLYLCHFFVKPGDERVDLKLIDVARVARLGNFLTRRRWIVKDLAQFWYSTTKLSVSDAERGAWLARYASQANVKSVESLKRSVLGKVRSIARHDEELKRTQPNRNVSLGEER